MLAALLIERKQTIEVSILRLASAQSATGKASDYFARVSVVLGIVADCALEENLLMRLRRPGFAQRTFHLHPIDPQCRIGTDVVFFPNPLKGPPAGRVRLVSLLAENELPVSHVGARRRAQRWRRRPHGHRNLQYLRLFHRAGDLIRA